MSEHPCKYCGHWPDPTADFSYVAVCNGETFCGEPVCRGKCYQCQNKALQARNEALNDEVELLRDPGWHTYLEITQRWLENYPADIFTGKSGDPGPLFVVAVRNALAALQEGE